VEGVGLFCVFDGHCGRQAAELATDLLPSEISKRLPAALPVLASGMGPGMLWEESFLATDKSIKSDEGCTATAVLVWRDAEGNVCLQVPPALLRLQFQRLPLLQAAS
jgi:serine/threonine protein phosphatase PrpC